MLTEYQEIYQGEIFRKSQCIELENSLMNFFQWNLTMLNYQPVDISKKIWQRGNKKVVVCLVDDVITCAQNSNLPIAELFDSNTVVITDNRIYSPTNYRVIELPASFFGIYYYRPDYLSFDPVKDINLSVNRLDPVRQLILLRLVKHNPVDNIFDNLNINFNCFMHNSGLDSDSLLTNFQAVAEMNGIEKDPYCQQLTNLVPIKTHDLSVEQAMVSSYVNMIAETYSGNDVVALSEKTFRALVTPSPWTLFSGRNSTAFLKSIGFDVLSDMVDHQYDYTKKTQYSAAVTKYIRSTKHTVEQLKTVSINQLTDRVQKAANHNQELLKKMRNNWPVDFAHWWTNNIQWIQQ